MELFVSGDRLRDALASIDHDAPATPEIVEAVAGAIERVRVEQALAQEQVDL